MSRDAKVGLVIIFSFVFILGAILVHRFHLTSGTGNSSLDEPIVSESDPNAPVSDSSPAFPAGDSDVTPVAVDGSIGEPIPSGSQLEAVQPRDTARAEAQRRVRTPNLTRPPTELPASQANGAMISLTDGESHSQPAAIVESTASEIGQNRTNRHATQAAPRTDELSDQGQSLLEISSHPDEIAGDDPHASEPSSDAPVTDNDAIADFVDKEQETEVMDEDELATTEPDAPSPEQQYALEHDRPPMSRSPRDELEMDEAANVQQVAGNRRTEGAPGKPPQLPRFGESRQATIESVPQRNGASDQYSEPIQGPGSRSSSVPRTAPGKSDVAEDRSLAEQRTYVVKEGDSFWSISAKQYGTGKYFRALEEFNGHRLAAYEDGRRILRPGSEILLPDPSVLRSKSAPAKQVGLQSAPHQNDGFTARKGLESSPARDTWNSRPLGANSAELRKNDDTSTTTYRVQEGDTLSVIAQRELGSSKRWQEIYELNRDKLDNRLTIKVGMELKLPAEQPVEKLVDRPRGRR